MTHHLPDLPFPKGALEPHISARTLEFHHGKHHQAYVNKVNELAQGTDLTNSSLEDIIQKTRGETSMMPLFNNAAQVWNHTFFWHSLSAKGGGDVKEGPLRKEILAAFGSVEAFKQAFHKAAIGQFGSGWAWVILNREGKLAIQSSANADIPDGHTLLTCDVWEHAYYLDYQNRRPDYVATFLEHLVNWDFMEENFRKA